MVGASILLLFIVAVTAAERCTESKIRDVDIIFELPQKDDDENFAAHIEIEDFIKSLQGKPQDGRCWKARIKVVDSAIIPIIDSEIWIQAKDATNSPRQNVFKILKSIALEAGENDYSFDSPRKLILLVLSDPPKDETSLEDNAINDLLEAGYDFITIGVGEGWNHKHFTRIAFKRSRIILIQDFQQLNKEKGLNVNARILSLLDNPKKEFPVTIGEYSSDDEEKETCFDAVDLGFVLDASGSVEDEYPKEKQFIQEMATAFGISRDGTHAGVIQFSHKASLSIQLDQYTDTDSFNEAVDKLSYEMYTTRIDLALIVARDKLFMSENGGRPDKKKVLVVLTDGSQTKRAGRTDPALIADEIRKRGIVILVIGIGKDVNDTELRAISGPRDNWRKAKDFDMLSSREFVDAMTRKVCNIHQKPCEVIVDICFLLDASGTINEDTDWQKLKEFVQRIANSFDITENGAHGSAVVFSDYVRKPKEYTKVTIYLRDYKTTSDFRRAIDASPYFGHRTRIDLAFKYAQDEVFNSANGARPNIKRVIILLTDGVQNPKGSQYDPVKASQKLYDDGVNIYAVGIGNYIDHDQLVAITRKPHRVFYAETFQHLESQEFVKNVSNIVCKNATTKPAEVKTKCCGGCPVYNNIFNLNMGPVYILNGAKLGKGEGKTLTGECLEDRCKTYQINSPNFEQLMKVIKTAIDAQCKPNCNKMGIVTRGTPAIASRKRRSVSIVDEGMEKLRVMSKLSKVAGCNMFLRALRKYGMFKNISKLMKEGKHVAIFCPIDVAYGKIYESDDLAANEKNILWNHVGLKHDKYGTMYRTLLPGGKILLNAGGEDAGKVSWKANGVDVIVSLADGVSSEIIIIKDIILPVTRGILDALKSNDDVSIFYEYLLQSQMKDVFKMTDVKKICFTKYICVSITPSMLNHLKDAINFKHFTIIAPTNTMFTSMTRSKLKSLMTDPKILKEFLQEHVFLGSLGSPYYHHKEIAYSISPKHLVLTMTMKENMMILTDANKRVFKVKRSIPVAEGVLHIVEKLE